MGNVHAVMKCKVCTTSIAEMSWGKSNYAPFCTSLYCEGILHFSPAALFVFVAERGDLLNVLLLTRGEMFGDLVVFSACHVDTCVFVEKGNSCFP